MMGNVLEDDLGEMYRQRGRWFLLLGGLLGGIIAIATGFGFWLEQWGNHIGGGKGENSHDIAVALAIAVLVVVIVIALMVWRASTYLAKANHFVPAKRGFTTQPSDTVSAAVAAWTSSALGTKTRNEDGAIRSASGVRPSTSLGHSPVATVSGDSGQRLKAVVATELTIGSSSRELSLADIIRSVENSGIAMEALWSAADPHENQVHLVLQRSVDSDVRLAKAGLHISTSQDVVLVDFEDHLGAAADIIRRLTDAGVRVSSAQLASSTRLIVISDDPIGATEALS